MTPEIEILDVVSSALAVQDWAAQDWAVECVVFDRADRPKRRHLLPLAALLAPMAGRISPALRDAS